ncbi:MAG: DUF1015 domain-containing protein [Desulfatiglandales bacterium]
MATVAPFTGVTYNSKRFGEMARLVAPPYDVISEEEQEGYYQKDPYNVIRLILGKKKIGDSDWDNRYTRSADSFNRWQSENVLVRSRQPSMYMTSLRYDPGDGGGERLRWGLIALLRIEEEGSGTILPHEKTFSAHKDDRLNLMKACGAQFSQIFGLYEDADHEISGAFEDVIQESPQFSFDLDDGTGHRLWVVQNRAIFERVAELMAGKSIFIADGHHRYETARNYRNMMRTRFGKRSPNRSYEYVMAYLSNMDDVGLTILPSHRLIRGRAGFDVRPFLERAGAWFDVATLPLSTAGSGTEWMRIKEALDERGRLGTAIGFYHHGGDRCYLLSLKTGMEEVMGDDLHPCQKDLDVLALSRFLLQRALGFSKEDLDDEEVFHYQSNFARALSMVSSGAYQMTFLLNPTRMEQVKEVAKQGLIMPRKSTYFYPKILTGLVFNKIDPNELIQMP